MGYITSNQGRPIQGVSQQPEKTRLPGQCTVSENFRPDIVRGLVNRQGTESIAYLEDSRVNKLVKWHHYERGTGEEYFLSINNTSGEVKAWGPDGTQHIINVEDNAEAGYLADEDPRANIQAMTVGDYTFLVNTTKDITKLALTSPAFKHQALFHVQFATYGQTIGIKVEGTVIVGGFTAYVTIPNGSLTNNIKATQPSVVIDAFYEALQGGTSTGTETTPAYSGVDITTDYNITKDNNIIIIERIDEGAFDIKVTDEANNKNSVAIYGKADDTTLLPGRAPEGYIVEIDPPGSNAVGNYSYFLKAEKGEGDHVTWRETISSGISVGPDPATMPHVLIRESITSGVATFTLRQGEWANRLVGSDLTNPLPTFINDDKPTPIHSIGIFQNRLFVTSGESVIMTRSADFFNFFRETAQAALDTDPIDIFADVPQVNFLKSHISFDGDLTFFSTNGQFLLDGSKPVTRQNATLRQVTAFESNLTVNPVASGDNVFFTFRYGNFTGIREFFTDSITDTKRARPVTDHVKQYIAGDPEIMATSTNLNLLLIKTTIDDNILYAYDWLWQGTEKVQSAWGKIIFPVGDTILFYEFVDEFLWIIVDRANTGVHIERVNMGDPPHPILGFPVRLDRRIEVSMAYYAPEARWWIDDPYPNLPIDRIRLIRGAGAYEEEIGTAIDFYREDGYLYSDEELADTAVTTTVDVVVGTPYTCNYAPTNPVALDENGYALNLDRLTVGAFYMNYNTTGELTATVSNEYGGDKVYPYGNRTLGGPENLIGFAPLVPGQHRVPIRQKADRYTLMFSTESHLPLEVRDFEYNGNMNRRGRRL